MSYYQKHLYFKKIAFIMSVIWTLITLIFFVYQLQNENRHILQNTLTKARNAANQAQYVINWIYDQKVKSNEHKKMGGLKLDFSLKDLIYKMNMDIGVAMDINSIESDFKKSQNSSIISKTINKMRLTKKEQYALYKVKDERYVFYTKPLFADKSCLVCHIYMGKQNGDILGSINAKIKIPKFIRVNKSSYLFLIFIYMTTWITGLFIIWFARYKSKIYFDEKLRNYEESIYGLVEMMERRDSYTAGHSHRVAKYSVLIAQKLNFTKDDIDLIFRAAMLHDIGKMDIPDALLLKPGALSDDEYELIKNHSMFGYELLKHGPFKELSKIVLCHHERYDGRGYPNGLKADEIPKMSQIISISDAFDAMTTNRAYKEACSKEEALQNVNKNISTQFNPHFAKVAIEALRDIELPKNTAQMPQNKLEEMRFCYYLKDQLTGCYNIDYLKYILLYREKYKNASAFYIGLSDFSNYNKLHGWRCGDEVLKSVANILLKNYPNSIVIRLFGDSFVIICKDKNCKFEIKILEQELGELRLKFHSTQIDLMDKNIKTIEEFENITLSFK
ncbi:MAG: HD domain-containing protein [Sulfurospirillum sp.]